ncbi:acyltransferase [Maribellus sediminis]|uniref:acyltransferase n=1 Tax=Maribellus sediminis TaxID=2696285 RepID=UPI001F0D9EFE|nr:acyltransferase [Maribellus sediminis]
MGFLSYIENPLKINGAKNIYIGKKVFIQYKTWIASMPQTGNKYPLLKIGNGSVIGNFNHIYATSKITIGEKVLTADKVYISDNLHSYDDITKPIIHQKIKQISEVEIGDGTWIGENVAIIGAKIGKNCVVGANSVVTKDIPDYCVAVGVPARIVKRFNIETNQWNRTHPDGKFIKSNS